VPFNVRRERDLLAQFFDGVIRMAEINSKRVVITFVVFACGRPPLGDTATFIGGFGYFPSRKNYETGEKSGLVVLSLHSHSNIALRLILSHRSTSLLIISNILTG